MVPTKPRSPVRLLTDVACRARPKSHRDVTVFAHEDVAWLTSLWDEISLVRRIQGVGDLGDELERLFRLEGCLAPKQLAEI